MTRMLMLLAFAVIAKADNGHALRRLVRSPVTTPEICTTAPTEGWVGARWKLTNKSSRPVSLAWVHGGEIFVNGFAPHGRMKPQVGVVDTVSGEKTKTLLLPGQVCHGVFDRALVRAAAREGRALETALEVTQAIPFSYGDLEDQDIMTLETSYYVEGVRTVRSLRYTSVGVLTDSVQDSNFRVR